MSESDKPKASPTEAMVAYLEGAAISANAYFEKLVQGGFTRGEALQLVLAMESERFRVFFGAAFRKPEEPIMPKAESR